MNLSGLAQTLQNIQNKYMQQAIDALLVIFDQIDQEIDNYAIEELYKEAWQMYDSFIDQFYGSYATKKYTRHGVGRGTRTGSNLYLGQDIKVIAGSPPSLSLEFNGGDMAGYKYDSTSTVLQQVMSGTVSVPDPHHPWSRSWSGSYSGTYFSASTPMNEAFAAFEAALPGLFDQIADPKLQEVYQSKSAEISQVLAPIVQACVAEMTAVATNYIVVT